MKKTFIFYFNILSKAWCVYKEEIEIESTNFSDALNVAIDNLSNKYESPLNIEVESFQIKTQ
jgi:hypothetical protein